MYSRNKLPFLSVGSGKFLTVILLVLELSRIMCNGYLLILLQYRRKALRPEKLIADILRHHIVQCFHKSQSLSHTWQRRSYHFHLTLRKVGGYIRVFPLVAKYCRVWSQGKRTVLIDPDIFLFKSETPLSKQMAVLFKYKAKILCIHILLYCMFDSLNSFSLFLYNR